MRDFEVTRMKREGSDWEGLKSRLARADVSLCNHTLGGCLRPYEAFLRRQTLIGLFWSRKPAVGPCKHTLQDLYKGMHCWYLIGACFNIEKQQLKEWFKSLLVWPQDYKSHDNHCLLLAYILSQLGCAVQWTRWLILLSLKIHLHPMTCWLDGGCIRSHVFFWASALSSLAIAARHARSLFATVKEVHQCANLIKDAW